MSTVMQNQYQRVGRTQQPSSHLSGTMSLNFKPKLNINLLQMFNLNQRWSQNRYCSSVKVSCFTFFPPRDSW
jgi:hypothetical protein